MAGQVVLGIDYPAAMNSRRIGSVVSVFAILGSLIAGAVPASAAPILGTGLIRIDGSWATVKTLSNGSTVLTLDKEASGQWMGEIGRSLVAGVRDIDDRGVVSSWEEVGYKSGVDIDATVTWNSLTNYERVDLRDPSMTPRGHLRFVVDADQVLPARMENVSVNIARSDSSKTRAFPVNDTYSLTATVSAQTDVPSADIAEVALKNMGTICYEYDLTQINLSASLPASLSCGSVSLTNSTSSMSLPGSFQAGNAVFFSTIVASGSSFTFSAVIATWTESGS